MTYEEAFNKWINQHSVTISKSTVYNYKKDSKYPIIYFGENDITKIKREDITKFVNELILKGYSGSTILSIFKGVKSTFEWLVDNGYIKENPCYKILLPKKNYKEINPFSIEEIQKILSVNMPKWVKLAIEIAWRTGMRKGEIFALKWSDVDFENNFIQVKRTQSVYGGKMEIKEPKTKSSKRRIMIDDYLLEILLENKKISNSEYVFSTSQGMPKIPFDLSSKRFKVVCKKAGVPKRRFHDLRHTHASILLSKGVHPKIVQERLGHSKISTTLDTYSHLVPGMQQEVVNIINKINEGNMDF